MGYPILTLDEGAKHDPSSFPAFKYGYAEGNVLTLRFYESRVDYDERLYRSTTWWRPTSDLTQAALVGKFVTTAIPPYEGEGEEPYWTLIDCVYAWRVEFWMPHHDGDILLHDAVAPTLGVAWCAASLLAMDVPVRGFEGAAS
jgi:hypothetical protein